MILTTREPKRGMAEEALAVRVPSLASPSVCTTLAWYGCPDFDTVLSGRLSLGVLISADSNGISMAVCTTLAWCGCPVFDAVLSEGFPWEH